MPCIIRKWQPLNRDFTNSYGRLRSTGVRRSSRLLKAARAIDHFVPRARVRQTGRSRLGDRENTSLQGNGPTSDFRSFESAHSRGTRAKAAGADRSLWAEATRAVGGSARDPSVERRIDRWRAFRTSRRSESLSRSMSHRIDAQSPWWKIELLSG